MIRRDFLIRASSAVLTASLIDVTGRTRVAWSQETPVDDAWRTFEVTTSVDVADAAGRTCVWLPLPFRDPTNYQRALETKWEAPGAARAGVVAISGYDVTALRIEWQSPESVQRVTVTSRVATCDRHVDLGSSLAANVSPESARTLDQYCRATSLLPTDGIVKSTAQRITHDSKGDVERARALYEWIVENAHRDPKTRGCGTGDVAAMLNSGNLGGKCADINGLFVAMSRSLGIPARDSYGIRVADSRLGYRSLGKSGDISKGQHCRAEFYAREQGWIPVDPADVRKVMLEETPAGLQFDDPKVQAARSRLFGAWEMNWVGYNHGHDVALPGSRKGKIPFLMYPNGETADGRLDSLDPTTFRYQIHSTEVTA
jgi:transglutaminase-like putative cysteine protease